ncbi:MAG: 3-dehydroquinate synthase, partial [Hungatella sp.]
MLERITVHRDHLPIYDILLEDSFAQLPKALEDLKIFHRKICIVTDSTVAGYYLEEVQSLLAGTDNHIITFIFPAGEASKNLDTVRNLYEALILNHLDRKDLLIALGGGVVGDLCGYAAATYLRGISFIQIPTTLLAQVDSSIGGKTGVDFDSYKNMVGAFHMPTLVYTNVTTLLTLSVEQFSAGMGEILKHGLIKDRNYYDWLWTHAAQIKNRDLLVCKEMILGSDEIKRAVVEADPTEQGDRALLNFGHTLGHGIEKMMNFRMLHGHCVGLGALAATYMSAQRGLISMDEVFKLRTIMQEFQMPVSISGADVQAIILATKNDKKMDQGRIRFLLLREIGHAYIDSTVTDAEMAEGLSYLEK